MFEEGQTVWIKSWDDIQATLDEHGRDPATHLYFAPEMETYCGLQAVIANAYGINLALADDPHLRDWYWVPEWLVPVSFVEDDPETVSAIDSLL